MCQQRKWCRCQAITHLTPATIDGIERVLHNKSETKIRERVVFDIYLAKPVTPPTMQSVPITYAGYALWKCISKRNARAIQNAEGAVQSSVSLGE